MITHPDGGTQGGQILRRILRFTPDVSSGFVYVADPAMRSDRGVMENTLTGTADVAQQIKQILVDDLEIHVAPTEIPDDCSLLERGLALDSILIAELIVRIEDRFGFQFDDRMLEARLFDNLSELAAFVARERAATDANAAQ